MNTTFCLCEKPAQARALAKILGADVTEDGFYVGEGVVVGNAFGHMLNLSMPDHYIGDRKWSLDSLPILPQEWTWQVSDKHRDHYEKIGAWLKKCDAVVIATDPDEEGEVIGRQILHGHGYNGKVMRLWASALDPASLGKALNNLLPLAATDAFYNAGRVRRELDWLYGMNLSRAFSIIFDRTTHVGRVKTRLLNELVKRDREIDQFVPKTYMTARVAVDDALLEWQPGMGSVYNEAGLLALSGSGACLSSELTEEVLMPPLPFTLSSLLAQASDMGISLSAGYAAAQTLYEAGAISYPRTSSTEMPDEGTEGFAAHHAIVNTMNESPRWMSDEAKAIFDMVRLNGVLQEMGPALVNVRRLTFDIGGEVFAATDRWVEGDSAAWLLCVPENHDVLERNRKKTVFKVGQKVQAKIQTERKQTTPLERFTEASMLRMMQKEGIGTEATRVDAISGLAREHVADVAAQTDEHGMELRKSLVLRSTGVGRNLIGKLPDAVTGPAMERQLRKALDAVRGGQADFSGHLLDATKWIARTIHAESKVTVRTPAH